MRKLKPIITVGNKGWEVDIPRPPKHATHVRMVCRHDFDDKGRPKCPTLPIQDIGCFKGVEGDFQYIRMNKQGKILEEHKDVWYWNGWEVVGIEKLIK